MLDWTNLTADCRVHDDGRVACPNGAHDLRACAVCPRFRGQVHRASGRFVSCRLAGHGGLPEPPLR